MSLKHLLRLLIRRIAGYDQELETLRFFLNYLHPIEKVGPTSDRDLRVMQECDALLLELFHYFCIKHNLTYWLDFGTLLGAIRHHGFVPWDDDMDVAMPRQDYNKAIDLLKNDLVPLGFEVKEEVPCKTISIGFKHAKTGIWLDVFPNDIVSSNDTYSEVFPKIEKCVFNYRKKFSKSLKKNKETIERIRKDIFTKELNGDNRYLVDCPEVVFNKVIVRPIKCVYPLTTQYFEGFQFFVPNNANEYLRLYYGNDYMMYPKSGVLIHSYDRLPMSKWAKNNNIDMVDIKNQLFEIVNHYKADINK